MNKSQKHEVVGNLRSIFESHSAIIVTQNKGISVADANNLRRQIKQSDGKYYVVKNKLAKIAIGDTHYGVLADLLKGPAGFTYSNDPASVAKVLVKFCAQNDKLQITGGAMGNIYLSPQQVKDLATLPSLDESRAKIIGLLNAPASKLVGVLQAPARQMVGVLTAYAKQ